MGDYPQRLYHEIPGWVKPGVSFHIRLRVAADHQPPLTNLEVAPKLLEAVAHYYEQGRWYASLFLLMPDHTHAVLAFPPHLAMSRVVGDWKRYTAHAAGIRWQPNYFDHRLRHTKERAETDSYILRNPVAKNLCLADANWPWVYRA